VSIITELEGQELWEGYVRSGRGVGQESVSHDTAAFRVLHRPGTEESSAKEWLKGSPKGAVALDAACGQCSPEELVNL
jgi:hypothetical protein